MTLEKQYQCLILGILALIVIHKEYLTPFMIGIPENVYKALIVHVNFEVYGIISRQFISINQANVHIVVIAHDRIEVAII